MSVECSFRLNSAWLLAAALTWKAWSAFPNVVEYTASHSQTPEQPSPNFHDTLVTRLGLEGEFELGEVGLSSRFGLVYEPTPAPEASGFHAYLDNDRWITSIGVEASWSFLQVAFSGQWHHLVERDVVRNATQSDEATRIKHGGNLFFWLVETGLRL